MKLNKSEVGIPSTVVQDHHLQYELNCTKCTLWMLINYAAAAHCCGSCYYPECAAWNEKTKLHDGCLCMCSSILGGGVL